MSTVRSTRHRRSCWDAPYRSSATWRSSSRILDHSGIESRAGNVLRVRQNGKVSRGFPVDVVRRRPGSRAPCRNQRSARALISGDMKTSVFTTRIVEIDGRVHIVNAGRDQPDLVGLLRSSVRRSSGRKRRSSSARSEPRFCGAAHCSARRRSLPAQTLRRRDGPSPRTISQARDGEDGNASNDGEAWSGDYRAASQAGLRRSRGIGRFALKPRG